jgi:hypothetical protein
MTGRRAGYCAGYQVPGFANGLGFRGGRGRGGGFGHRHWYHATGLTGWQRAAMGWPTDVDVAGIPPSTVRLQEQNVEALEKQAAIVEQTLKEINSRIQEIKSSTNG